MRVLQSPCREGLDFGDIRFAIGPSQIPYREMALQSL